MQLEIFMLTEQTVRINTEKRFCAVLIDWLIPYVKREVKKALKQYNCVSFREAFDQVLIKEDGPRAQRFQIYQEIIDMEQDWDLAKINE